MSSDIKNIDYAFSFLAEGKVICRIPDRPRIGSLMRHLYQGKGLTEKQREMLVDIVHRYRKQYRVKHNIDVTEITSNPVWTSNLLPPAITRISNIDFSGDRFVLTMAYNEDFVSRMRELKIREFYYEFATYGVEDAQWYISGCDDGAEVVESICEWLLRKEIPYVITGAAYERIQVERRKLKTGILTTGVAYPKIVIKDSASANQEKYARSVLSIPATPYVQLNKLVYAGYQLDDKLKDQLRKYHSHLQVEILSERESVICLRSAAEIENLLRFVYNLNLGKIVQAVDVLNKSEIGKIVSIWDDIVRKNVSNGLEHLWQETPISSHPVTRQYADYLDTRRSVADYFARSIADPTGSNIIIVKHVPRMPITQQLPILIQHVNSINMRSYMTTETKYNFEKVIKVYSDV